MRKVCVFTGTRAEYGLLYWLLRDLNDTRDLSLQLVVTGSHLSKVHGNTIDFIRQDGFDIDLVIDMNLAGDTPKDVLSAMSKELKDLALGIEKLNPDVMVILGDRYEALIVAIVAFICRIPILHIHGGEITEGAYDDGIRHSITKFAQVHCTAAEIYKNRVIQLGESPDRVHCLGAIGLDYLKRGTFLDKETLFSELGVEAPKKHFLITYHPATLADEDPETVVKNLFAALEKYSDYSCIFTLPNMDVGNEKISELIKKYVNDDPKNRLLFASMGQKNYLSAASLAGVIIGNSSSGIIEAPALGVPSVNIGDRQKGRLSARSVLHSNIDQASIEEKINEALTIRQWMNSSTFDNPYGKGEVSKKIVNLLRTMSLKVSKKFFDLPSNC